MDQTHFIAKHVVNLPNLGISRFNCGGFVTIKILAAVLIPSNSMGLENALGLCGVFNSLEFEGFRIGNRR